MFSSESWGMQEGICFIKGDNNMKKMKLYLFAIFLSTILNAQELFEYNSDNSILPSYIGCIAVDSSNSIWVGASGGAYSLTANNWVKIDSAFNISSEENNPFTDIEVSPNGDIWFGLNRTVSGSIKKGLYSKKNNDWKKFDFDYGLRFPNKIFIENDTTLYLSLYNFWPHQLGLDAVGILQNEELSLLDTDSGTGNNVVFPLSNDTLIGAGWRGISFFNDDTIITKNPEGIEELKNMWNIAKLDDRVFVYDSCLYEYYKGAYVSFPQIDSILSVDSSFITCMNIENKNTLWMGTDKGKLIKHKNREIKVAKLVEEQINDLVIDKNLNKWFTTYTGCYVYNENLIVEVGDEKNYKTPTDFLLFQNYPNPFNPSTIIKYSIPTNRKGEVSNVKLVVYDILGREVATLVNREQSTGNYEVQFNASELTSGIYFYKFQSGDFVESKKMILIR